MHRIRCVGRGVELLCSLITPLFPNLHMFTNQEALKDPFKKFLESMSLKCQAKDWEKIFANYMSD